MNTKKQELLELLDQMIEIAEGKLENSREMFDKANDSNNVNNQVLYANRINEYENNVRRLKKFRKLFLDS